MGKVYVLKSFAMNPITTKSVDDCVCVIWPLSLVEGENHGILLLFFFKILLFKNSKKLGLWCPAPSVYKWNKIINFALSVK